MQKPAIKKLLDKPQKISLKSLSPISNIDLAEFLSDTKTESSEKIFQILLEHNGSPYALRNEIKQTEKKI
ncbi:MAG: hypothetical protein OXJ52_07625 [Oligoflexia bacterium]|nr:hypothetical protein [Oligoflexia bacterium]